MKINNNSAMRLLILLTLFISQTGFGQILVMETGSIVITHDVSTVTLNNTFIDPVVILSPVEDNGPHEATARLENVTENSFDLYIEEPEDKDGPHTTERVYYIVVEKGRYTFGDGTMVEAGTRTVDGLNFQTVPLMQTYATTPAIFTQIQTNDNGTNFLKTRQRNATASSFQYKLEREESLNGVPPAGPEVVGYVAISKGGGDLNGVTIETGSFSADDNLTTHNLTETFSAGVNMIASIATYNGGDPANLRWRSVSTSNFKVFVDEDESNDSETGHATETIDFFVIDDNGGAGIFLPGYLPIELLDFNLETEMDNNVKVSWSTASELNNDYFLIEKSQDGVNWTKLDVVDGAGTSTRKLNYSIVDDSPYSGVSYYRLSQTDFDGSTSLEAEGSVEVESVSIYPNPSNGNINISVPNMNMDKTLKVYDAMGRLVLEDQITFANANFNFDLNPGHYFLQVEGFSVTKFIIE